MNAKDLCKIAEIFESNKMIQGDLVLDSDTYSDPWEIGRKYFIRTVTMHLTGELIFVGPSELVLRDAAWVADSGRFSEAIKDPSKCTEVEPFSKPVIVGRGSIVDATEIPHIITEVK